MLDLAPKTKRTLIICLTVFLTISIGGIIYLVASGALTGDDFMKIIELIFNSAEKVKG